MKVIITYDVSQRHNEVKSEMLKRGFQDRWTANNTTYYLPNTTLWHPNLLNTITAINIFNDVIRQLNNNEPPARVIKISHLLAFELTSWSGIQGDEHV